MRNLIGNITELTNDDNGICASQSGTGGTALLIDGVLAVSGAVSLDNAQRITVTSAGNDSGITFAITGYDPDGTEITETLTGANAGAATTTAYFSGVTQIVPSGDTAAAVIVGPISSNGAVTKSLRVNGQQMDFKLGLFWDLSGVMTATVEHTADQPEDSYSTSFATNAKWWDTDGLTGVTADGESNVFYKVNAVRLKITAYTSGTSKLTVTQSF